MTSPPNGRVNRATAKQATSRARPAEQPIASQAENAAAVASVAPFVRPVLALRTQLLPTSVSSDARETQPEIHETVWLGA
jgi:hypothetical protein